MLKGDIMKIWKWTLTDANIIQNLRYVIVGLFVNGMGMLGIFGVSIAPKCGSCGWKLTILQLLTDANSNYYIQDFIIIPIAITLSSVMWFYVGQKIKW